MDQPLYTVAQLRSIEATALRSVPAGTLMQRAGSAAARFIHARHGAAARGVLILCGPGNNGGDGFACAAELRALGHRVLCVAAEQSRTADARAARERWHGETMTAPPSGARFDVVVDALFGIGLRRPLGAAYADQVNWINAQPSPVIALDVPSGLDADTGSWVGPVPGVRADCTVTFLGDKPGLHTGAGADAAGAVIVACLEVDCASEAADGALVGPASFTGLAQPRRRDVHKGSHGNVLVVGGGAGMVGAALLAGRAALRLGAGRVFVDCIGAPQLQVDPLQPELMFRHGGQAWPDAVQALVVGCGLGTGPEAEAAVLQALASPAAVVFDADALNLVAHCPPLARAARDASRGARVYTQHPLEAARLLGVAVAEVQRDRVAAARALAAQLQAGVVLKGAGTVVTWPDAAPAYWINPTGSAALATAGTGDVLAGMLGALLAQSPPTDGGVRQAVLAAVWLHGRAAELHGADIGLVAGDVVPLAARALAQLRSSSEALTAEGALPVRP
jgi:ADP-dependent NAD(P)H-hydrate dehydratase / NAD(P)H-hydrate epimerase